MSPSEGAHSGGEAMAAIKGAALIGLAVLIGVLLLQQVDKSKPVAASASTTTKPKATTTTTTPSGSTATTSTVPAQPAKPPAQLKIIALNSSGRAGAATNMSNQLRTAQYTNQIDPNDWSAHHQTGNTVMCKPGLTREASSLAVAVGSGTPVPVVPYAPNLPSYAAPADCVVVVGA